MWRCNLSLVILVFINKPPSLLAQMELHSSGWVEKSQIIHSAHQLSPAPFDPRSATAGNAGDM